MPDQPVAIEADSRGRVSLNVIRGKGTRYKWYLAEIDDVGVITLRPAVIVPKNQIERTTDA